MGTEALIVGAGPTGLTLAIELTRYGVPVRIVEKAAQRTDKSKALVLWPRTLELLDRGPGAKRFVDAGWKADAASIIAGDHPIARVDLTAVKSPYRFALMIPQSETERLLEESLEELGLRVERQVELVRFTQDAGGVDATVRSGDGREENIHANWLLGCDGAHSLVRHSVGATFAGETMNSDWILADVHMRGYPLPDTELSVYWHKDGAFVVFPITPGRYRVLADLPPSGAEHPPAPTLQEVQRVVDRRGPPGMTVFDPIWLAGFRINGRKVSSYRWGRAFLCGDAAHVHSPAGGQGMNTGMQDTFNLAWKLAITTKGLLSERVLDTFSPERSDVGDRVLSNAARMTEVATLRNPVAQTIRNAVGHLVLGVAPVQHAFAGTMSEVSVGYPRSPLNGPSLGERHAPRPGERMPPAANEAPVGSGSTPRFALFADESDAVRWLSSAHPDLLDPLVRKPPSGGALWLVRPDGYVACVAAVGDEKTIADYLRSWRS